MITNIRVLVSIEAESPKAAYDILCDVLGERASSEGDLEYTTDTYSTDADPIDRDATELWPQKEES